MEYPALLNCDIQRKNVIRKFRKIDETTHPFNCAQFNQVCDLTGMKFYSSATKQGIMPLVR